MAWLQPCRLNRSYYGPHETYSTPLSTLTTISADDRLNVVPVLSSERLAGSLTQTDAIVALTRATPSDPWMS